MRDKKTNRKSQTPTYTPPPMPKMSPPKAGTTPSPKDINKGCQFCATPIYIIVKKVYDTGESYIHLEKNYCPVCGRKIRGIEK